jgi:hypothetical protein
MLVRLLTAALVALALAAQADAAPSAPPGFYGVSYSGQLRYGPEDVRASAWNGMAANGVESARTVFSWANTQPEEGASFDFAFTDGVVGQAAQAGVELLPIVMETPFWARTREADWWPERPARFGAYMTALVARYGPDGSFWSEHPQVPERPIRDWQIYNEPGKSKHYAPLLRAAHRRVKDADPGAKIVFAGLTGTEGNAPWDVLRYQYRRGGIKKRWFDVAAMHLYTGKAENVDDGVRLFRRVMKRNGDRRKPVWLTEFGITASKGRTTAPRSQRTLRTTDEGMASFLEDAYRTLARKHQRLRLARAYWYTWASSYEPGGGIFDFAGLNRYADGELDARPALASYRESASR